MSVRRTPPPESISTATSNDSNCGLCKCKDEMDDMVQCDDCNKWYHFSCVKVNSAVKDQFFRCPLCVKEGFTEPIVSVTQVSQKALSLPSMPIATQQHRYARKATSCKSEKLANVKLQSLEEEHNMREKREKEFLRKKLEILEEMVHNEATDEDDEVSSRHERTVNWVTEQHPIIDGTIKDNRLQNEPTTTNLKLQKCSSNYVLPAINDDCSSPTKMASPIQNSYHLPSGVGFRQSMDPNVSVTTPRVVYSTSATNVASQNNLATPTYILNTTYSSNTLFQANPTYKNATYIANTTYPVNATYPSNATYSTNLSHPSFTAQPSTSMPQTIPHEINSMHLAARQATPKELPVFSGSPEEWPVFYSTFINTTATCNFSNQENMVRLQRCLKGKALDVVRYRLLIPEMVEEVITTLKMMFGRPELILHQLIAKLKGEVSPKEEKLDTLVAYALSVQNISATMQTCGMESYNNNPFLLQELVEKLPPSIRLNWAIYKQTISIVNITVFANWLYEVAKAASDITIMYDESSRTGKDKGFLNAHEMQEECQSHQQHNQNLQLKSQQENQHSSQQQQQSNTTQTRSSTIKCIVCETGNHLVKDCNTFLASDRKERWRLVADKKLCRNCLQKHGNRSCKSNSDCRINGCTRKHHSLLHNNDTSKTNDSNYQAIVSTCNTHQQPQQSVFFRILPVTLYNNKITISTFAFLDEGSSLTLIEKDLAKELHLRGTPENLRLRWTAGVVREEADSERVSVKISGNYQGAKTYVLNDVRSIKKLSLPNQSISAEQMANDFKHLSKIPISSYTNAVPKILIGINNWKLGLPTLIREGKWQQPVATKTRLGWVIHGVKEAVHYLNIHSCECRYDVNVHRITARNKWQRILEVKTTMSGHVRQAVVQTKDGLYTGPVAKPAVFDVTKPAGK